VLPEKTAPPPARFRNVHSVSPFNLAAGTLVAVTGLGLNPLTLLHTRHIFKDIIGTKCPVI
jgi:hypothetical protein